MSCCKSQLAFMIALTACSTILYLRQHLSLSKFLLFKDNSEFHYSSFWVPHELGCYNFPLPLITNHDSILRRAVEIPHMLLLSPIGQQRSCHWQSNSVTPKSIKTPFSGEFMERDKNPKSAAGCLHYHSNRVLARVNVGNISPFAKGGLFSHSAYRRMSSIFWNLSYSTKF